MEKKRIVIVGTGYVGRSLERYLASNWEVMVSNARLSDISVIFDLSPDVVINCAGKKDIAWCQSHPSECLEVNAVGAGLLARHAWEHSRTRRPVRLIHVSTDYAEMAGGALAGRAYIPSSHMYLNYAVAKLFGERLVAAEFPEATIVRTAALFDANAPLVKWLGGQLSHNNTVEGFSSLFMPTYMPDFCAMMERTINEPERTGIVYLHGGHIASRYAFLRELAKTYFDGKESLVRSSEKTGDFPNSLVMPSPTFPEMAHHWIESILDMSKEAAYVAH